MGVGRHADATKGHDTSSGKSRLVPNQHVVSCPWCGINEMKAERALASGYLPMHHQLFFSTTPSFSHTFVSTPTFIYCPEQNNMRYSTVLALTSAAGLVTAVPLDRRAVATFPAGTTWDIILQDSDVSLTAMKGATGTAIDVDLFDNIKDGKTNIKELAKTKKVICYFSAGSREGWRDDAKLFKSSDYGKAMDGWPDENWVDVKSANVRAIMKTRIELAAASGCTAIDPDNIDGYDMETDNGPHQDGYTYPSSVYAEYVNYLASVAHANNLAIGLKNALDIIPSVLPNIQFAVNEQCHDIGECDRYKSVTKAGLAVFNIEYESDNVCTAPSGVTLSTVVKSMDLNTLGGQCKK